MMYILWITCLLLSWLPAGSGNTASYTRPLTKVVSTKYGVLRGLLTQFTSDLKPALQPVEAYLGIPYAAAPVGSLRFMPPTTPSPFEGGVRNATHFGPVCPQAVPVRNKETPRSRLDYLRRLDVFLRNQSEDCLYLNIYVPSASREERESLPVLIYIHGESYSWGSGNPYDGSVLASYGNIIVVTLNYRLGPLGFLTTDDGHARGNYGLMDQVAAIRFVEENIEQFGGDAGNITLLGQGSGAACVNLLMISPVATNSKRLFQRAILLSGSALAPHALSHDPRKYTLELARALHCPTGNSPDLVRCLKTKTADELVKVPLDIPQYLTGFGPAIDGVFIPNQPRHIMRNYASLYRKYGLMIGLTRSEAAPLFTRRDLASGFDEARQNRILRSLVRNLFAYHLGEVFMSVKFEYADWDKSPRSLANTRDATLDVLSDALTVAPLTEAAQLHAGAVAQETYMFLFQHAHRAGDEDFPTTLDSVAGDELPFLFGAPLLHHGRLQPWGGNYSAADAYVSEVLINLLANYIRTGDPRKMPRRQTIGFSDAVRQGVTSANWPKFDADRQRYLQLSARSRDVRNHYRAHKTAFWTELIPKLNTGTSPRISPDHHAFSDFDNMDTYDGLVRTLAFLTLPPPPLPPSSTPPPWRNKTRSKTTSQSTSSTAQNTDVLVTPLEPEPMGYNSPSPTTLTIMIAVGCTIVLINILICIGVCYRSNRKKYLSNRPLPEKRNGVTPNPADAKAEEADHAETLLPPSSSSHNNYSVPGTPLPVMHYHPGRTFNTFSDPHFQLPLHLPDAQKPLLPVVAGPPGAPPRSVPLLGLDHTLQRRSHAELLRKAATLQHATPAGGGTGGGGAPEQDETAV
ncbi:neuroligin-1-like [Paramacrobiotus metropolitanus]|uniref:neuroligin-1-like n=1 Tax=Paramacrobiotus metropolitanus TaxID=2943436 RepID=UPI0024464CE0|nr:neuroligin-1-like [Paramacrobiotus metropolitanus]